MRTGRFARYAVALLAAASLSGGGLALATNGGPGNSGPVKPGKGCGDKNHYHEKESQCKKPPR
jgi:hypothetical protein